MQSQKWKNVHFQGKSYNTTVMQVYAPISNPKEAEITWFYDGLHDLLGLISKYRCLFHHRGLECKSKEIPGVTDKFGFGVQNEAGQRLTAFCQENVLVLANTLFQQHKRPLYTWTSPDVQY